MSFFENVMLLVKQRKRVLLTVLVYYFIYYFFIFQTAHLLLEEGFFERLILSVFVDGFLFLFPAILLVKSCLNKQMLPMEWPDLYGCMIFIGLYLVSLLLGLLLNLTVNLILLRMADHILVDGFMPDVLYEVINAFFKVVVLGLFFWLPLSFIDQKPLKLQRGFGSFKPYYMLSFSVVFLSFSFVLPYANYFYCLVVLGQITALTVIYKIGLKRPNKD
ncbi:MAG: hypothetical protein CMH30_04145 [Micavibrio sp.]|nr:hypothetical protein [Micavibrio sp.]|tara:strand:- start:590 stop:1243 length:654 start_codon:yes stop_codon:yes gene_type:complete